MGEIIESNNYPFMIIELELDNFKLETEAYVDTGAEGYGLFLPKDYFMHNKVKQNSFTVKIHTADGLPHFCEAYTAQIKIGNKYFNCSLVLLEGGKKLYLGREILDQIVSIFDGPNKKLILKIN